MLVLIVGSVPLYLEVKVWQLTHVSCLHLRLVDSLNFTAASMPSPANGRRSHGSWFGVSWSFGTPFDLFEVKDLVLDNMVMTLGARQLSGSPLLADSCAHFS